MGRYIYVRSIWRTFLVESTAVFCGGLGDLCYASADDGGKGGFGI